LGKFLKGNLCERQRKNRWIIILDLGKTSGRDAAARGGKTMFVSKEGLKTRTVDE